MRPEPLAASVAEALFAPIQPHAGAAGQRLVVWHQPQSAVPHSLVVHAHAFAEEMNKARRMVALQAKALAERGCAVLLLDLAGCGDSPGDFSQARWQTWLDDLQAACAWGLARLRQQWPQRQEPVLWLWGLRAGCLLANAVAAARPQGLPWNQLLWQPQTQGKTALSQFTRLKTAAGGLQGGDAKALAEAMKQDFAAGRPVEIAGYWLHPELAQGLEQAKLQAPAPDTCLLWLETSTREPVQLLPASLSTLQAWGSKPQLVTEAGPGLPPLADKEPQEPPIWSQAVAGPAFWSTTEIEDAPALVAASCELLLAAKAPSGARP